MLAVKEVVAASVAGSGVVVLAVVSTLYMAGDGGGSLLSSPGDTLNPERYAFEMSDAIFSCRDELAKSVPYKVRNIDIDSHSSRYEAGRNVNLVFLDLEVVERPGSFYTKYSYEAKVACSVSAASNEVISFKLRRR